MSVLGAPASSGAPPSSSAPNVASVPPTIAANGGVANVRNETIPLRVASVAPLAALTTLAIVKVARASPTALLPCSTTVHGAPGHAVDAGAADGVAVAIVVCTLISQPLASAKAQVAIGAGATPLGTEACAARAPLTNAMRAASSARCRSAACASEAAPCTMVSPSTASNASKNIVRKSTTAGPSHCLPPVPTHPE